MNHLLYPPSLPFWQALQLGYVPEWRSEAYLAFVRTLPSVISGDKPCVAHHLVGHGLKGNGTKVHDMLTFPLTEIEHTRGKGALHAIGSHAWEIEHDDQRVYVLQTIVEAIHRGIFVVAK